MSKRTWIGMACGVGLALAVVVGRGSSGAAAAVQASTPEEPAPRPASSAVANAPLRVVAGRLVVTASGPDEAPLDFLVSTANATTVLTESARSRLGEGAVVRLGDASVDLGQVHVVPDTDLALAGATVVGIVGANTLNRYDVLLDAPGGRLLLQEIGPRVEWPGVALASPVRMRVYHGTVLGLDVTVNGTDYMAALDLGTSGLLVNEALRAKAGLEAEDTVSLGIGEVTFATAPTSLSENPMFERWDPTGNGFLYVGAAIATDCAIALSWVHAELRTCVR